MKELEIKIRYDTDGIDIDWDVDAELFQDLDNDAEFDQLLDNLGNRFRELVKIMSFNRRKKEMQASLPIIARRLDDTIPIIDALCDNSDDTAEYRATIKSNINAAVCALLNAAETIADLKAQVKQ